MVSLLRIMCLLSGLSRWRMHWILWRVRRNDSSQMRMYLKKTDVREHEML